MKAVILSCNTGQGHNSAARAVQEALALSGEQAEVVDGLSFAGKYTSELLCKSFIGSVNRVPQAFGQAYRVAELISSEKYKSPIYTANILYAERLLRYIQDNYFDTVICSHLFPAEALTFLRRRRRLAARCYIIGTDYACIPFWQELDMDAWMVPHGDLVQACESSGIPEKKLIVTGIPVSQRFNISLEMETARQMVGIPSAVPAFLVMTGGEGCGDALLLTKYLLAQNGGDIYVVALTGRNGKLWSRMQQYFRGDPRVKCVMYTSEVQLYMDACDAIITKPGGLSSTEIAVKNKPLIHVFPIPGVETKNAAFFAERGMSMLAESAAAAAESAMALTRDTKKTGAMLCAQRNTVNPNAAKDIVKYLLAANM